MSDPYKRSLKFAAMGILAGWPGVLAMDNSSVPTDSAEQAVISSDSAPWKCHAVDNSSKGADGVKLGDINGDGLPDVVTGWEEGGEVRVYVNPGPAKAGEPWPRVTVGTVKGAEDAIFADLDGDGQPEVVSLTEGKTKTIFRHRFNGKNGDVLNGENWTTEAIPASVNKQLWMQAVTMDVDGQNGPDIVVGSKLKGGAVGWFSGPAKADDLAGWTYHKLRDAGWIMSLEKRDMDGDGDPDVVLSDRGGERPGLYWLENPGAAANRSEGQWKEHAIGAVGRSSMFLDIADVNGDGLEDVVAAVKEIDFKGEAKQPGAVAGPSIKDVVICLKQKDSIWKEVTLHLIPEKIGEPKAVKVADVNGDGLMDIVFTAAHATSVLEGIVWLEQQKDGPWLQHRLSGPDGIKFDLIQTVDFDGDGDLDLLTTEERDQLGVVWYENPTRSKK